MLSKLTQTFGWSAMALSSLAFAVSANASVNVTLGTTPTTNWSSTPTIGTPDASYTNLYAAGATQREQTITVNTTFQLDKIEFSYGIPASSHSSDLTIQIWDTTGFDITNTSSGATNAWGDTGTSGARPLLLSANSFHISTSSVIPNGSIITFDLTGSDEITLQAGHTYAIATTDANRNNNMNWGYTDTSNDAASPYVGGAAFNNESAFIGTADNGQDFAFALYAIPEPATAALLGLGGLLMVPRRRRA